MQKSTKFKGLIATLHKEPRGQAESHARRQTGGRGRHRPLLSEAGVWLLSGFPVGVCWKRNKSEVKKESHSSC